MAVSKGLRHRTLSAATAEELRRRIMSGELPSGSALRQDALAQEFGISRIPLREAFLQLEAEGLLRILPHRGAVVSEVSAEDVSEIFELRILLEPQLLALSAPHLDPADFDALRRILDLYGQAIAAKDVRLWGELNTEFHLKLYERARRPRSLAFVANLLQECDRLTRIQLIGTRATDRAQSEHERLLALCEAGEVAEAVELLGEHIRDVRRALQDIAAKARKAEADPATGAATRAASTKSRDRARG